MHVILALCLTVTATFLSACSNHPNAPLATVGTVKLERYAGKWFEIARLPNSFQKEGASATAQYTLLPTGKVEVLNTETQAGGKIKTAKGSATVVPDSGNARLKVRFEGIASLVPVPEDGNYWIIGLKPDYSVALVGTPDRKFLWLLARQPKLDAATQTEMLKVARDAGFPVEQMEYDKHGNAAPGE